MYEKWARDLKVPCTPCDMASALIKEQLAMPCDAHVSRNFKTAMAVLFALSWVTHRDWLARCSAFFCEFQAQNPDADWTPEYLYEWAAVYRSEKENVPG